MKSKVWFAVPTLVLLVLVSYHANSETKPAPTVFTGKVIGITDGDTVKVLRDNQTVKIRLSGIDAPEMDQPFGKQSKRFVSKLIFGKTVDVKDLGLDRYKRTLGYITEGSTEVNEAIVAAGLAWHYSNTLMTRSSLRLRRRLVRPRGACGLILSPCHRGSGGGSARTRRQRRRVSQSRLLVAVGLTAK